MVVDQGCRSLLFGRCLIWWKDYWQTLKRLSLNLLVFFDKI